MYWLQITETVVYSFKTKTITYHGKIDEKDNGKRQDCFFVGRVLYVIRLFFSLVFVLLICQLGGFDGQLRVKTPYHQHDIIWSGVECPHLNSLA